MTSKVSSIGLKGLEGYRVQVEVRKLLVTVTPRSLSKIDRELD